MDKQLQRIRDYVSDQRKLNACLAELPRIQEIESETKRRSAIDTIIRRADKNGLTACGASKAADGVWYIHVDDFIKWLNQGMRA